ncbi:MAG: hypothetical protein AAF938_29075 [Myxococcota bacterium]
MRIAIGCLVLFTSISASAQSTSLDVEVRADRTTWVRVGSQSVQVFVPITPGFQGTSATRPAQRLSSHLNQVQHVDVHAQRDATYMHLTEVLRALDAGGVQSWSLVVQQQVGTFTFLSGTTARRVSDLYMGPPSAEQVSVTQFMSEARTGTCAAEFLLDYSERLHVLLPLFRHAHDCALGFSVHTGPY